MRSGSSITASHWLSAPIRWMSAAVLYAGLWALLWHSSVPFWFLPAGLRFVLFLLLPRRWLAAVLLGDWLTCFYATVPRDFPALSNNLVSIFAPSLACLLPTQILRSYLGQPDLKRVQDLTLVLAAGVAAAILSAAIQGMGMPLVGVLPNAGALTNTLTYAVGDVAGILFAVSVLVVVYQGRRLSKDWALLAGVLAITVLVELASRFAGDYAPHLRILIVVPILIAAMRQGVAGAALAIVIANIVVAVSASFGLDQLMLFERQLMFLAVSVIGLLFGAAMGQQRRLREQLRQSARRMVELEETQRKRLAQDLHDDVGQILTALRTRVAVIQRRNEAPDTPDGIGDLSRLADQAYQATYQVLHDLRPRVLDELGLRKALESGPLRELATSAGIRYESDVSGSVEQVNPETALMLYRIAQEAVTNCTRHAAPTRIAVMLAVSRRDAGLALLLRIADDGCGLGTQGAHRGMGLQGIEDRVAAVGGQHILQSTDQGTTHEIRFTQA